MPEKTSAPATVKPPVGTPPAGGRWTWDGTAWVPLPEPGDEPAAISAPAPAPKE